MIFVFLGPTLTVLEAQSILNAKYLPPVQAGDVAARVQDNPTAFVIIDGYYEQCPAVRHKEILYALSKGIPVFGAASMGALRAAELHAFGMVGVGTIFERFRDGTYEDDDEVAVSHAAASDGYRPLSDAMVNLRDGLALARDGSFITRSEHDALIQITKGRFYPDRSWQTLRRDALDIHIPVSRIDPWLAPDRATLPDSKADDARALLAHVANGESAPAVDFDFESTTLFEEFLVAARERLTAPDRTD